MSRNDHTAAQDHHIAIASPFCWPEVRRGGERMHADLTRHLVKDGHAVTFVSSAPRADIDKIELPEGITEAVIVPRSDRLSFGRYFNGAHEFRLRSVAALRGLQCDTFLALTYFDAAAWLAARAPQTGQRFVMHSIGVPIARAYRRVPWDGRMLRRSIRLADRLFVLSRFAADHTFRSYGRMPDVLPPPVTVSDFQPKKAPLERITILFSGDVNEPRKGADLLIRAAISLTGQVPEFELQFSGAVSAARQRELQALVPNSGLSVTFLGTGNRTDLPDLYRQASILVLPSAWEAFGIVLVEALAAGTPVVAARQGGAADIVDRPGIGSLFDMQSEDSEISLAQAILRTLEMARAPETIISCRKRALDFDWSKLGAEYRQALA